ncbi:MAG: exodeoxyribonuclease VII large subunit, partial [Desulfobulbus sp.]
MNEPKIFSVTELTTTIKNVLEQRYSFIRVAGEVTNLRKPGSGHCYFTLKDNHAQIKTVLFKTQQRYLEKQPQNGQMIICQGRISVYEPRGDYQLIVDTIDFHGAGALQLAFEQLKVKLDGEGLFDRESKKKLPLFPRHITLVTSPTGAAVHDFITIALKRLPQIRLSIFPVKVQGETAAKEIQQAIIDINHHLETDIIVLTRGGGSIEDLWAFNDEQLARTIHHSTIPIVSAVGHEIDFTIADFAADLRAPTPSGCAEMLVPDRSGLSARVLELSQRICHSITSRLEHYQGQLSLYGQQLTGATRPLDSLTLRLDHISENLEHAITALINTSSARLREQSNQLKRNDPALSLRSLKQNIHEIRHRLYLAEKRLLMEKEQAFAKACDLLDAVSPLATMARGYAIA